MNKDKQIEEMAEIICQNTEFDTTCNEIYDSANALYNAGYRKASEVAREIFEEIEKFIIKTNGMWLWQWDLDKLAELKKNCTGGKK